MQEQSDNSPVALQIYNKFVEAQKNGGGIFKTADLSHEFDIPFKKVNSFVYQVERWMRLEKKPPLIKNTATGKRGRAYINEYEIVKDNEEGGAKMKGELLRRGRRIISKRKIFQETLEAASSMKSLRSREINKIEKTILLSDSRMDK